MRAFILTAIIIVIAFVVKVDLTEGSIPLAALQTKSTNGTNVNSNASQIISPYKLLKEILFIVYLPYTLQKFL
ncbi:hypothetical protein AABM34_16115 [Lysinibacillus fusiformis]